MAWFIDENSNESRGALRRLSIQLAHIEHAKLRCALGSRAFFGFWRYILFSSLDAYNDGFTAGSTVEGQWGLIVCAVKPRHPSFPATMVRRTHPELLHRS
jgi:hypothetical protein